jgi:hypothetical protein
MIQRLIYVILATSVALSCGPDRAVRPSPVSPSRGAGPPGTFTLSGLVRATPLNELVAGVQIDAEHGGAVVASAVSDANGAYRIAGLLPQEYVLRLRKVGYNRRGLDVVVAGDSIQEIVIERNRRQLQGIAREALPCSPAPIESALVQIVDGPDAGKSSLTNREGLRYLIDVAWGTFRVRTSKHDYATSEVTVTIPASDVVQGPFFQDFDLPRTLRQSLSGEVRVRRTEFGERVAGARVEITSGPDAGRSAISDSMGRYRIDSLATGVVNVRVTSPGYVEEVTTAALCGDRQMEIRLTPANSRFEGTVLDATSGLVPLEGVTVEMVSGPLAGQTAVTTANGQYTFTGVYGTFTARASKIGYTTEERTVRVTDPIVYWNFGLRRD